MNVGHESLISIKNVAQIIIEELKLQQVQIFHEETNAGWKGDSPRVELNTQKLRNLGWSPTIAIETSIRRTVRFLKKQT